MSIDFEESDPNAVQKFFVYAGDVCNFFARDMIHVIEKMTRPSSVDGKIQAVASIVVDALLAIPLSILSLPCYYLGSLLGSGRFEKIGFEKNSYWEGRRLTVMSLNACFQDPWSPFTGGVTPPLETMKNGATRVANVAQKILDMKPDVFLGQEVESLRAQDALIEKLKANGYTYFVRDLGCNNPFFNRFSSLKSIFSVFDPFFNNSGLFVASKVPLQDVKFVPYRYVDREGLAIGSKQGALSFKVGTLQILNVHLNYGNCQEARCRQIQNYILPILGQGPAVLFGDLNFDTLKEKEVFPERFVNAIEGEITCTDLGKHTLRGKRKENCEDCEESLDGVIYDPEKVQVKAELHQLKEGEELLSDHLAAVSVVTGVDIWN